MKSARGTHTIAVRVRVKPGEVSAKAAVGGLGKGGTGKGVTTSLLVTYASMTYRKHIFMHRKCVAVLNPTEVKED